MRFVVLNPVPVSMGLRAAAGTDDLSVTNASDRPFRSGTVDADEPPLAATRRGRSAVFAGVPVATALPVNALPGTNAGAVNDRLLNFCSKSSSLMLRSRWRRSRLARSFDGRLRTAAVADAPPAFALLLPAVLLAGAVGDAVAVDEENVVVVVMETPATAPVDEPVRLSATLGFVLLLAPLSVCAPAPFGFLCMISFAAPACCARRGNHCIQDASAGRMVLMITLMTEKVAERQTDTRHGFYILQEMS